LVERVEIVAVKERRRRWSDAERRRLVAEAFIPGTVVAHVARRNGVAESCLYAWRRRYGADAGEDRPRLIPVVVDATMSASPSRAQRAQREGCQAGAVVMLPDGTRVEIAGGYPSTTLRTLIAALRRAP
jgi:transposase